MRSNAAWRLAVGAIGALLGLVALVFPPAELAIAGGAVVALTLAGAGFGAWTAAMIGVNETNARLERFRGAIRDGQLLIMADVPGSREHEIEQLIIDRAAFSEGRSVRRGAHNADLPLRSRRNEAIGASPATPGPGGRWAEVGHEETVARRIEWPIMAPWQPSRASKNWMDDCQVSCAAWASGHGVTN
jgi:hypothetical protein